MTASEPLPLSDEELAERIDWHQPEVGCDEICATCRQPARWPCEPYRMASELRDLRSRLAAQDEIAKEQDRFYVQSTLEAARKNRDLEARLAASEARAAKMEKLLVDLEPAVVYAMASTWKPEDFEEYRRLAALGTEETAQ